MNNGIQNTFLTKYRPQSFEECLGNTEVIRALADAVRSKNTPHCYIFTGSSGIGKTTLARIIAKEVKAAISEIDVALNGSVDDMRQLSELCGFKPITIEPNKLYIIDECHNLGPATAKAWQPLLKLTEDCAKYNYFALCTTEPQKIPDSLKSRSYSVSLRSLKLFEIEELISFVAEQEEWPVNNDVFQGIVIAAAGSARQALSYLQAGHACTSKDKLAEIILQVDSDNNPAIKLAQTLLEGGRNWKNISQLLLEIEDEEKALASINRYLVGALVKSEETKAREIHRMIESFTEVNTWDKKIQLYTGVGKILW